MPENTQLGPEHVTIFGRLSFTQHTISGQTMNGRLSYPLTILLPPQSPDYQKLMAAFIHVMTQQHGADTSKWPPRASYRDPAKIMHPANDRPDWYDLTVFNGWTAVRTSGNTRPQIVMPDMSPCIDPNQLYSGRWAYVGVNAYWFDAPQQKGLTLGLNAIQLMQDDERIGGGAPPPTSYFQPQALPQPQAPQGQPPGWQQPTQQYPQQPMQGYPQTAPQPQQLQGYPQQPMQPPGGFGMPPATAPQGYPPQQAAPQGYPPQQAAPQGGGFGQSAQPVPWNGPGGAPGPTGNPFG